MSTARRLFGLGETFSFPIASWRPRGGFFHLLFLPSSSSISSSRPPSLLPATPWCSAADGVLQDGSRGSSEVALTAFQDSVPDWSLHYEAQSAIGHEEKHPVILDSMPSTCVVCHDSTWLSVVGQFCRIQNEIEMHASGIVDCQQHGFWLWESLPLSLSLFSSCLEWITESLSLRYADYRFQIRYGLSLGRHSQTDHFERLAKWNFILLRYGMENAIKRQPTVLLLVSHFIMLVICVEYRR